MSLIIFSVESQDYTIQHLYIKILSIILWLIILFKPLLITVFTVYTASMN